MMTHGYNGSQVLFRQAKARALAAQRFAREAAEEESAGRTGMERRQRERDAVIATVILAQGAAEGYVNWVYLQAGIPPSGTWIDRWRGLRNAAARLGRDDKIGLPKEHKDLFNELDAWRNFLLHGDEKARESLHKALASQGLAGQAVEVELFDGVYALNVMDRVDAACRWAEARTGISAPAVRGAWVAADEC
ncbi:hypothetical protein ACFYNF_18970 [Streptomyces sp. NPDC006641]|uniref:hypothetical protein n=1 Tax=unclassified Streptomyces TaxID=2593676 RepID=UPI002E77FB18|nr:hypothetical protein [Streptomyces sp. JV184]MEE1743225.1 hypothetical protein [Streptomyces sp. JV184]